MQDLAGKVAIVTGGGSGLGRAMALTFADEGMHIAIADVEPKAANAVADEIRAKGVKALTSNVDVTDLPAMRAFAEQVTNELGSIDIVCNNAGVAAFRPVQEMTDADWDWVIGVDLIGVVNGVKAFLPQMLKQGRGGHIVNTASIAGVVPHPGIASYTTAKNAVVGLTEGLELDLKPDNIGASVLCPGLVKTRIAQSGRNRPQEYGGPEPTTERVDDSISATGIDPMGVGQLVLRAVKENQLYIFTHQPYRAQVEARHARIMAAHDWAGL